MNPVKIHDTFTCLTCHVAFKTAVLQREHYRNDWHRYNLKRKVLDLPPVSAEEFQQKVMNQQNIQQAGLQDNHLTCTPCKKAFKNQRSYDNHLNSKKHKSSIQLQQQNKNESKKVDEDDDSDVEEVSSDEWDETANPIEANKCMFCLHHSKSFLKNLEHMTVSHSFFIPDIEYCTDVYSLLVYLAEKIFDGYMCLWCNEKGRSFHSADAVRKHMIEKGHCRMLFEDEALAEYTDFYDYSTSYPDVDNNPNADEEVEIPELTNEDYQLVLPSGSTIGHRSLMRYYKQSLNPNSSIAVAPNSSKKNINCFNSIGWVGKTSNNSADKIAKDIIYMKKLQAKLSLDLGVKGNKLQKYARCQVKM